MSAAPQLWTKHRGLARALAAEITLPGAERQDVEQEALIGLWIAALRWDHAGGANFRTFAALVIRRRLWSLLQMALREKHVPLNQAVRHVVNEDGEWLSIVDVLPGGRDPVEVVIARETIDRVATALAALPGAQRDAIVRVANGERYSRHATGSKRMENLVDRARRRLREAA